MRCASHSNQEAIAVCTICGAGVCGICQVTIAGISYCTRCLDAGRYQPPSASKTTALTTKPSSVVGYASPNFFLLSTIGFLFVGVAVHLLWLSNILYLVSFVPWWDALFGPISLPKTISYGLIGGGITLAGFAFHGYRHLYGSRLNYVAGLCSFLFAWWLFIGNLLQFTGLVWHTHPSMPPYYYSTGPLFPVYFILEILGMILFCCVLCLWAASFLSIRILTTSKTLALYSSLFLLIAIHVLLLPMPIYKPYDLTWIYIWWWAPTPYTYFIFIAACFIEPAMILAAICVVRSSNFVKRTFDMFGASEEADAEFLVEPSPVETREASYIDE